MFEFLTKYNDSKNSYMYVYILYLIFIHTKILYFNVINNYLCNT